MHNYIFSNWDGKHRALQELTTSTTPSVSSPSNIAGSGMGDKGNALEMETISLDSLFDEDVAVTFASPNKKRSESERGASVQSMRHHHGEALEAHSVYSVDAEGEDDDGSMEVNDLLPFQKNTPRPAIHQRMPSFSPTRTSEPLGIPSPHGQRTRQSTADTPVAQAPKRYQNLAFVEIPRLQKGNHFKRYKPLAEAIRPPPPLPPPRDRIASPNIRVRKTPSSALTSVFRDKDSDGASFPTPLRPDPLLPQSAPKREAAEASDPRPIKKSRFVALPQNRLPLVETTPLSPPPPTHCSSYDPSNDRLRMFLTYPESLPNGLDLLMNTQSLLPGPWDQHDLIFFPSQTEHGSDHHRPCIVQPRVIPDDSGSEYSVGETLLDDFDDDSPLSPDSVDKEYDVERKDSSGSPSISLPRDARQTPPPRVDLKEILRQSSSAQKQRHQDSPSPHGGTPTTPSQKALGKRRADPSFDASPPLYHVDSVLMDAFLHSTHLSPDHRHFGLSTLPSSIYRHPQASAILYSSMSSMSYYRNDLDGSPEDDISEDLSPFLTNHASSLEERHMDDVASAYSMTTLEPWNVGHPEHCFDTINPTLLQQPDDFVVDTSYNAMVTVGNDKYGWASEGAYLQDQEGLASPATSSSSLTRSSSPDRQKRGCTSPAVRKARTTPSELDLGEIPIPKSDSSDEDWRGSDAKMVGRGKRKKRRRIIVDFGGNDDEQGDGRSATAKTSPSKRIGPPRNSQWERGEDSAYCHQCRSKTFKLKMKCEVCDKEWCNRCISIRYPEITFKTTFAVTHPCPKCLDSCNCDICTRKRGEVFVSSAYSRRKTSATTRESLPRRPSHPHALTETPADEDYGRGRKEKLKKKKVQKPMRLSVILPMEMVAVPSGGELGRWGPVYGLDGFKMITGPVGGDDSDIHVIHNAPKEDEEEDEEEEEEETGGHQYQTKRVFIGALQHWWGLGGQPRVVYLEPLEDKDMGLGGGMQRMKERRGRMYVGRRAMLHLPLVRPGVGDCEGNGEEDALNGKMGDGGFVNGGERDGREHKFSSLTPLSDEGSVRQREAAWRPVAGGEGDGGGGGDDREGGKSFPEDGFGDNDIARAITLSLTACGLSVKSTSPTPSPSD